ncbi:MAG: hypothetical protein PHQ35_03720 [Phycisphaerae bacterium]|nr:hypothetical protein [Phycisphaerae bacterium]MDD5380599.1 hypothetical protein [Phycisphaerae bacterium]
MSAEYSVKTCIDLDRQCRLAGLHRPIRVARYESGTELVYDVTEITKANSAKVRLVVDDFVGGGFAGQVYKIKILNIEGGPIEGLKVAGVYAMKILVPPSGFSCLFRNVLYWIGFQGPFQLQVNPAATRAGSIWQKFIRRGAQIKFGNETTVADIYATLVDNTLGSCGELREWVDGRTWRLEVDDRLDLLKQWRRGKATDQQQLGSPEYRAKKLFMKEFVALLHEMGAYEFARQYEWSTCKSQPNCLKRKDTEDNPSAGLVAVDFRAGLALLPFLPMSPGDFKLIAKGAMRGSLVQFDRGDIDKLETFVKTHSDEFADMRDMLDTLRADEQVYRDSLPDITHNHIRLFYSRKLWSTIFDSAVTGWKVRNLVDEEHEQKLRNSKILTLLFFVIGIIPFFGRLIRRLWAQPNWRKHYKAILTSWGYLLRAFRTKITEKAIVWHRAGRISSKQALKLAEQPWRYFCHLPFLILIFPGLHRFLTDWAFFKDKLHFLFVRPIKLYFSAELREKWLLDMVKEGKKKHILTDQDANTILSQLHEPYIQRYLVSLVVHLMTLPLTQIVSGILAWIYWRKTGDELGAGGILVLFQVIPISPGSLARGLYAVGIAIYDRSFKDYNIAVFLSFLKYVGYLAFPIQMTYRYPALARFMAAHWATDAVHIVPVFGEAGALLEHWVFCLFYNWPLTIRRRMRRRAQVQASMKPRYWHVGLYALAAALIFGIADFTYLRSTGELPNLKDIWWLAVTVPLLCGIGTTLGCRGAALWKRIIAAVFCGIAVGILYTIFSAILSRTSGIAADNHIIICMWRMFAFAVFSTIGALITELSLPEPDLK